MSRSYGYCRVHSMNSEPYRIRGIENYLNDPKGMYVDAFGEEMTNFNCLKEKLSEGDVLWMYSLDDLGDSLLDILHKWELLRKKRVNIRVIDLPGLQEECYQDKRLELISNLLSFAYYMTEQEKQSFEPCAKGKVGRPKLPIPEEFSTFYGRWKMGEISARDGQRALGLKANTWYRMVKDYEAISELPF